MRKYLHRYYRWRKNRIPLDYKNPSAKREKFALKAYLTSNYASGILSQGMDLTGRENTDEIKNELTLAPPLKHPDVIKVNGGEWPPGPHGQVAAVGRHQTQNPIEILSTESTEGWVETPAEWAQDSVKNKEFMPHGSSLQWLERFKARQARKEAFEARREQWKKDNPL